MREPRECARRRRRGNMTLIVITLALFSYVGLASSSPAAVWPSFPKRNVQALARDGLLRTSGNNAYDYKRSISTLAKNGQLPTFRAPEDNAEEDESDRDVQNRNMAAIARLRSYAAKRNIGAMMRNGFRAGKRDYEDKRNIGSLARNGYLKSDQDSTYQKRDNSIEDEYYYPFYQNSIPPLSELDFPLDYNELYDLQQSMHPDVLPPLSEIYDKRNVAALLRQDAYNMMRNSPHYRPYPTPNGNEDEYDQMDKRNSIGLPNHGLYRTITPTTNTKRYIFSIPELAEDANWPEYDALYENQEKKSVDTESEVRNNFEKRHIGALARLGWLPSFRYSGSRYSRSGRARFLMPTVPNSYRKHSDDEDLGIGEYITNPEGGPKADTDDADLPPPPIPADSHPAGRGGGRPVSRPADEELAGRLRAQNANYQRFINAIAKNRWEVDNANKVQFYNFRSLKVPKNYQRSVSEKRYLLLPAVDNIMLRKTYPNNNLPSRRKNQ